MAVDQAELSVELQAGPDTDAEELAQIADQFRAELLDLDVDTMRQPVLGTAPEDAKGAGLLVAGQLVANPEALASIFHAVRSWLGRNLARSVGLTLGGDALEVGGVSSAEQDRLIDLWVSRHATGG
jgi:hypothetical protein